MTSSRPKSQQPSGRSKAFYHLGRREFLVSTANVLGTLALGNAAVLGTANAQGAAGAAKFTDWGWPQPYEQVSPKSKQWLESKGWWPLNAAWVVVWSGEEMINNVLQTEKLLEERGIEMKWQSFVAAGFSNEAFVPGRLQLA